MWDINRLSPEDRSRLGERVLIARKALGAAHFKTVLLIYIAVVSVMWSVLTIAHGPMLRTLIMFAIIAAGVAIFFRNPMNERFEPRPLNPEDEILGGGYKLEQGADSHSAIQERAYGLDRGASIPEAAPAMIQSESPGGAATWQESGKLIHSPGELPPELAANPEVHKLFELAGARGVLIKGEVPHVQLVGPTTTRISITTTTTGHQPVSRSIEMDKLPPELGASPDPQKLFEWVKSHGMLSGEPADQARLTSPISDKTINVNGLLNWLAVTVLLVAIAMGSVALWVMAVPAHH